MLTLRQVAEMIGLEYQHVKNWPDKKCFDFPYHAAIGKIKPPRSKVRPTWNYKDAPVLEWIEAKKKERQYIIDNMISLKEAALVLGLHHSRVSYMIRHRDDIPTYEVIKSPFFHRKIVWFNRKEFMRFADCRKHGVPYIREIKKETKKQPKADKVNTIDSSLARAFICRN